MKPAAARAVGTTLGVALLLSAPALLAQAPIERKPPPFPNLTVQSRLVGVPINVMDERGAPVPDLTRDDFTLFEDGQPQKIAIFERETSAPLSIVLAIDASESVLRDENLERNAAKHFVKALVRPQDEVDLMEFSDTVREVVSFTNDARRIDALSRTGPH